MLTLSIFASFNPLPFLGAWKQKSLPALRQAILLFHTSLLLNLVFPNADRCLLLLNYLYIIKKELLGNTSIFFLFSGLGEKIGSRRCILYKVIFCFFGLGLQIASEFRSDPAYLQFQFNVCRSLIIFNIKE